MAGSSGFKLCPLFGYKSKTCNKEQGLSIKSFTTCTSRITYCTVRREEIVILPNT